MTLKFLVPLAFGVIVLSACDSAPEAPDSSSPSVEDNGTTTMEIEVPDAVVPAIEALENPEAAFEALRGQVETLRQQASTMSEEAKQDAVVAARNTAEEASRALGRSDAEIREAGDTAEANARQALGL